MTNEKFNNDYDVFHSYLVEDADYEGYIELPKIKTSRAAAKRFKTTGTGKIVRNKAYKSHILTKKSQKRKRNLRKATVLDQTNVKSMKKILPYL